MLIRAPTTEERSKGYHSFNAFLDILGDFELTKRSLPVFNALFEGKRPLEREKARSAEDMVHREGSSYGLEYYPDPFVSFVDAVSEKLSSIGRALVDILHWRYAQEGPPAPIASRGLFCSDNNGVAWHPVPGRYSIQSVTPPHSILEPHKVDQVEIRELLESNSQESVGHELLREAKELQFSSPRSAVLIAVSAAEVAVKTVIISQDRRGQGKNLQGPASPCHRNSEIRQNQSGCQSLSPGVRWLLLASSEQEGKQTAAGHVRPGISGHGFGLGGNIAGPPPTRAAF